MSHKLRCSFATQILRALPIDGELINEELRARARLHALDCESCFSVLWGAAVKAVDSGAITVPPLTPERRRDLLAIPYEDYSWAFGKGHKWAKRLHRSIAQEITHWRAYWKTLSTSHDSVRSPYIDVEVMPRIDENSVLMAKLAIKKPLIPILRILIGEQCLDVMQSSHSRGIKIRLLTHFADKPLIIPPYAFEVVYKEGTPPRHTAAMALVA